MTNGRPVVGVDLGGTNMQIGVVRSDARKVGAERALLGASRKKTPADEGLDGVVAKIVEGVGEACREAGVAPKDIAALGIGAPGAVDPRTGVVLEAVNLRWTNVKLAKILKDRLDCPVVVDNDVNVAVYGEHVLGAAREARFVLGVWVGTGIGGGLILNGEMYYGHTLTAGEIGHMLLLPTNPPGHRSLEHNCSRTAVVDRVVRLMKSNHASMLTELTEGRLDKIKSKALAKAYEAGDQLVVEVVNDSADMLGMHIGGVVTLLGLELVVLGGGLTEAIGRPFVERVRESVRRIAFPAVCKEVRVAASELEDNAGLLGAAMLAVDRSG